MLEHQPPLGNDLLLLGSLNNGAALDVGESYRSSSAGFELHLSAGDYSISWCQRYRSVLGKRFLSVGQ
jgi:hypothetical protein